MSLRGIANVGFIVLLCAGVISLLCAQYFLLCSTHILNLFRSHFSAGYPILSYILSHEVSHLGGHNIGGINGSGQVPVMTGHFGLIDPDTPNSAYYYNSYKDNSKWQIIFSDEFNVDGRSFYDVRLCYIPSRECSSHPNSLTLIG